MNKILAYSLQFISSLATVYCAVKLTAQLGVYRKLLRDTTAYGAPDRLLLFDFDTEESLKIATQF